MQKLKIILLGLFLLLVMKPLFPLEDVKFSCDSLQRKGDELLLQGNVKVFYGGVTIKADKINLNQKSGAVDAPGKVEMTRPDGDVKGFDLKYNFKLNTGGLTRVYGHVWNLVPKTENVQGDLFFWGEKMDWKEGKIFITAAKATSCDIAEPGEHYFFKAREIEIIPNQRMISRKVQLFVGGKQYLGVPTIVTSLAPKNRNQAQQSYIPRIAYNKDQGFQVKEKLNYTVGEKSWGAIHLDYYGKAAIGKGFEHYFESSKGNAGIYYYDNTKNSLGLQDYELSGSFTHRLPGNFILSSAYKNTNQVFPGFPALNAVSFAASLSRGGDLHSYSFTNSLYKQGANNSYYYGFNDRLKLSSSLNSRLVLETGRSLTPVQNSNIFHVQESLRQNFAAGFLQLDWEEGRGSEYYRLCRRPELKMIFNKWSLGEVPLFFAGSYGKFSQVPDNVSTSRWFYTAEIPQIFLKTGPGGNFMLYGGYKGYQYDQGQKFQLTSCQGSWHQNLSRNINFRVNYLGQRPVGATPLYQDAASEYYLWQGGLQFRNKNYFAFELFNSYDLLNKSHQDLNATLKINPNPKFFVALGSNYNWPGKCFSSLDTQLNIELPWKLKLDYWQYYDFNLRQLTYQDYSIYKDLHCWGVRLTYRKTQQQYWLTAFLKAFPTEPTPIGVSPEMPVMPQNYWEKFNR